MVPTGAYLRKLLRAFATRNHDHDFALTVKIGWLYLTFENSSWTRYDIVDEECCKDGWRSGGMKIFTMGGKWSVH